MVSNFYSKVKNFNVIQHIRFEISFYRFIFVVNLKTKIMEEKKSSKEVAKDYEKVIKKIESEFKFNEQFLELKRTHELKVRELNKSFNEAKDAIFSGIVKQECLKFGAKESNIRKIAGY